MDSLRRRVAERLAVSTSSSETPTTAMSESNLRQYWMPDAVSVECYECSAKFTTFRRKHHCRVCGQIFCSKCCNIYISGHYLKCSGSLRVCTYCYKYFAEQRESQDLETSASNPDIQAQGLDTNLPSSPSSSFLDRHFAQRWSNLMGSNSFSNLSSASDLSPGTSFSANNLPVSATSTLRKRSSALVRPNFLTMEDELEGDIPTRVSTTQEHSEPLDTDVSRPEIYLKDRQKLGKLWEQIASPANGIPLQTRRVGVRQYSSCFTGNDIIDWLQSRDSTMWRSQALAVGQTLLDAGYLEDLSQVNGSMSPNLNFNENAPYRPLLREEILREDEQDAEFDIASSSSEFNHADPDGPDWLKQVDFPMEGNDHDVDIIDWKFRVTKMSTATVGPELPQLPKTTTKTASNLDIDGPCAPALDDIYQEHIDDHLKRLMKKEKLSSKWTDIIKNFTQKIVSNIELDVVLDPDLKRVNMDIRDFVKIKRIPGGTVEDCSIVKGEVFSNRVIRVGMPLSVDNANVLLLKDAISYARDDRYVSLANMKLQEEEYTKNICHKIKSFQPNLILVERSMCRSAQDILFDANISVILNVKPKILKRVSRFFDTPIVTSLTSLVEKPNLGACDRYRSRMYKDVIGTEGKNLITLEGRDLKNGCTILLRGGNVDELSKVKRVIQRILLVKCHCKYERSFLLHEDVQTEKFLPRNRVRFHEMTLSPFVRFPSEFIQDPDSGDSDDDDLLVFDEDDESNGFDGFELVVNPSVNGRPVCNFEREVFKSGLEDPYLRNLLAEYRAQCSSRVRLIKSKPKSTPNFYDEPSYYQEVESKYTPMLFGSHAPATVSYCVPPWIVKMSFYHQNDIPLGWFLESFCFDDNYKCPCKKDCQISMRDHIRRFCMGDASVTLMLQSLKRPEVPMDTGTIFMWKFCNECKNMSTILPLGYNAWMLSFTMFLVLSLNETELVRRTGSEGSCPHSIHRDQFTCFAKDDVVALFKVSPIVYRTLVFPSRRISLPPVEFANEKLLSDIKDLSVKGSNLFSQINAKIIRLKAEGVLETLVSELLHEQEVDFAEYRKYVEWVRDKIRVVNPDTLNEAQGSVAALTATVHSAYMKWESKLLQFLELRKREEKSAKSDPKQRISSGSGSSVPPIGSSSALGGVLSASHSGDKALASADDQTSTTSRIWQSVITSGLSEYQLTSPFSSTVHPSLPISGRAVLVDEAKPSSIVAYALTRADYHEFLARRSKAESDAVHTSDVSLNVSEDLEQSHFECQFSDDNCKFYVCIKFAQEFAKLREKILIRDETTIDFINSLSDCKPWKSTGGKSGMTFFKTADERFIIKQMSSFERNSFQDFAPHYFQYVNESREKDRRTLLAKILGVYTVGYRNTLTGKSLKLDFLAIENLFYKRNIHESYDLKGSVRNRLANAEEKNKEQSNVQVLMDENLLKIARENPFYIRKNKNPEFYNAIHRDTQFLTQHSMMDYSLLVGIDADTNELVLGIIDYIRTFTWDKKLEMIIKSTGILGGRGKTPTIIYPKSYQTRFIEAMDTYFIQVPDYWHQYGSTDE